MRIGEFVLFASISPLSLDIGYFSSNWLSLIVYPLPIKPFTHSVIHPTCQVPGAS
jgi:hypothetical protein